MASSLISRIHFLVPRIALCAQWKSQSKQNVDTKRLDVLKKVSELCALFVFKEVLIFFSPSNKALRSGHSDVGVNIDCCDNLGKKQLEQMKLENERKGQRLQDRPIDELNLEELLIADAETTEFIEKLEKVH
ncbi:hypothetical protein V6N13_044670 [Hibiscus sabdariffa]